MSTNSAENADKKKQPQPRFVTLCGRVFHADPKYFPQVQYHGRILYLCTDVCRDAFLADPDRFVAGHKKSYKKKDNE